MVLESSNEKIAASACVPISFLSRVDPIERAQSSIIIMFLLGRKSLMASIETVIPKVC